MPENEINMMDLVKNLEEGGIEDDLFMEKLEKSDSKKRLETLLGKGFEDEGEEESKE